MHEAEMEKSLNPLSECHPHRLGAFSLAMLVHVTLMGLTLWIQLYDSSFSMAALTAGDLGRRLWQTLGAIEGGLLLAVIPFLCVEAVFAEEIDGKSRRAGSGRWCVLSLSATIPFYLYAETRLGAVGMSVLFLIKIHWLLWALVVALCCTIVARLSADADQAFLRCYELTVVLLVCLFLLSSRLGFLWPWGAHGRYFQQYRSPSWLMTVAGLAVAAVLATVARVIRDKRRCLP
ncbi:MAG TPA: hypothetical protein PKH07_04560 [bacterium]|nr:hypothetical protein [bacterium]